MIRNKSEDSGEKDTIDSTYQSDKPSTNPRRSDAESSTKTSNHKQGLNSPSGASCPLHTSNDLNKNKNVDQSSNSNSIEARRRFLAKSARINERTSRLTDPNIITQERFKLLDCLSILKRKFKPSSFIKPNQNKKSKIGQYANQEIVGIDYLCNRIKIVNPDVRSKGRSFLEESLTRGMMMSGVPMHNFSADAYPALLACELEAEVYKKYPNDKREYLAKIRSLRYNLEDIKNPTLCSRVLLQEISLVGLVNMSPEQLASRQMQEERAKAKEEALREVLLSTGDDEDVDKNKAFQGQTISRKFGNTFPESKKKQPIIRRRSKLRNVTKVIKKRSVSDNKSPVKTPELLQPTEKGKQVNTIISNLSEEIDSITAKNISTTHEGMNTDRPRLNLNISAPFPSLSTLSSNTPQHNNNPMHSREFSQYSRRTGRYSPPPSPAFSVMSTAHSTSGASVSRKNALKLKNGGDIVFEVNSCTRFETRLVIDVQTLFVFDNMLPAVLTEIGSLKIEKVDEFVTLKTTKSNWKKIALRLSFSHTTRENKSKYKKFYKEYESNKKIAMFQVKKGTKLFIVTPKYLRYLRSRCLKNLITKMDRSHAILLTKENLPTIHPGSQSPPKTIDNSVASSVWGTASEQPPQLGVMLSSSFGSQYSTHNEQNIKTEMKGWGNNTPSNPPVSNRFVNTNSRNEFSPEPDMMINHQHHGSSAHLQHNTFGNSHNNSSEFHGSGANHNSQGGNSENWSAEDRNRHDSNHVNDDKRNHSSLNRGYEVGALESNMQSTPSWGNSRSSSDGRNEQHQDSSTQLPHNGWGNSNNASTEQNQFDGFINNHQFANERAPEDRSRLWPNHSNEHREKNPSFRTQQGGGISESNVQSDSGWGNTRSSSGGFGGLGNTGAAHHRS